MASEISQDAIAPRGWTETERLRRRVAALEAEIADMRQARRVAVEIEAGRAALRDSEARYRLVIESATDYAIFTMDLDRRVTGWNVGAERVLGWTEAEAVGQPADMIFTPEDRKAGAPEQEARSAVEEGRAEDVRWHLKRDGSHLWANGVMLPLRDDAGSIRGLLKILRDKTAEKRAGDELREQAGFLQSVLASSGDCIKVLDLDGRLVFMSEGGQRVMEVGDFNAIRGCPWTDFWQGQGNADAEAAVETAKAGGTGRFQGAANTMAGTPRYWDVQVTPILGADGRPEKLLSVARDVTEARETRQRLELALDAGTVVGTWMWDVPGDHFTGDSRFARFFSLDPDRLAAGVPFGAVVGSIHLDDLARVEALVAAALTAGGRYSAEYRVRQPDGAWLWVEANGHCDLDADGRPLRFPGVVFNIDRRKRHELRQDALLDLGERLRALRGTADVADMAQTAAETLGRTLGVSHAGYGRIDAAQRLVTVDGDWCASPSVGSVVGVHGFDDYGTCFDGLLRGEAVAIPDVERDARTRPQAGKLRGAGVKALLNVPLMQQGQFVAVLFLHDDAERTWTEDEIAFVRTVADRTWAAKEQAWAEARLRRFNETLEIQVSERTRERDRLWDLTDNLLVEADYTGRLLRVSKSWTRLLGHSEAALLARPYGELVHPDDLGPVVDALLAMRASGRAASFEDRVIAADGSWKWIAWTLTAEPDGERLLGIGRDVTEEKAAAAIQGRLEEQLRQSQKMEAVGQLTGGLAHDFNNLLAGISGSLELLQARVAQGRIKDVDRYVNAAQGASKRAAALTHRLLAFSRQQTLDPRPTDMNRLVSGMEELVRRTVGPAITVEMVAAAGLWTTLVDPHQLENALLNLCINARDAMPDGGRLTVETGNKWLDERAARERELPPGQYVSLCVSDTGTGMAPDVVQRAFDPFFTTKPIGQGTGLGLSMIYGFVRQSGGQARIYSEVGQGTTVCLYLPRHHGAAEDADGPGELAEAPQAGAGETVLVVDDEPTVRMLVTEVLEDLGYSAVEAADGAAGLRILQSNVRVDLLITDVGLPGGMNGRQVADAGRAARPGLKVLFITGYAENAVLSHGHLEPGMHMLTKPFAMEALASRIKELITAR